VDVLVYNAGSGSWGSIEEITPEAFEAVWRVNALGSLLVARQVIPAMKRAGAGQYHLHRCHGVPAGDAEDGGLRARQGRAAYPRGIHGALALAGRHSRGPSGSGWGG
jgi:NAD(P)-dependent dehydrogenase (short-subunit alcohol dehydrogenase family)